MAILLIASSFMMEEFASFLLYTGLFALSGAVTNQLAIFMLFEKVPFLYGSGVIPLRFEAFKLAIKNLMMSEFFTIKQLETFFASEEKKINLEPIIEETDFSPAFDALSQTVMESSFGGMLGMFGLSGTKVFQESATLSGGEKTKLALAMLMVGRNNLLFLDEPTNNLDPPSRQAVADALSAWKGAIILVSHDTEFVEQLAPTKVLLMPDGQVDYFSNEWLDLVSLA